MNYYKHKNGEVFAYKESDIQKSESINSLENDLANAKSSGDEAATAAAQNALHALPQVFFRIRDNIAQCELMTDAEVQAHINPPPTPEQLAARARAERDKLVAATDWLVIRHRDEIDTEQPTTLTATQYAALLDYRRALRDVPLQPSFPAEVDWPVQPALQDIA